MAQSSRYNAGSLLFSLLGKDSAYSTTGDGGVWTPPARYIAIMTAPANSDSTGGSLAEANYNGYSRVAFLSGDFDISPSGYIGPGVQVENFTPITFPIAGTPANDLVVAFAWVDDAAKGAGNVIAFGDLGSSRSITTAIEPVFEIGDLKFVLE